MKPIHAVTETSLLQVGAPDPELRTSPIVDETQLDEHAGEGDLELEEGACYFNGERFALSACVRSGSEILECSGRGVWVVKGEVR